MSHNTIPVITLFVLNITSLGMSASNNSAEEKDWMIDSSRFKSQIIEKPDNKTVELTNGLLKRTFRISPNAATVALENLMTGASELRSVRPEAVLTIDDREIAVGGLQGQPVHNFLLEGWVDDLKADPLAFEFVSFKKGKTTERFPWKKHPEWMSQDLPWPPPGVSLTFNYKSSEQACIEHDPTLKRPVLLADDLSKLDQTWRTHITPVNEAVDPDLPLANLSVSVHYELYDGIPLIAKWIELKNSSSKTVRLNSLVAETLAMVESTPKLYAETARELIDRFTPLHVVTDYAFGGDMEAMKDNDAVFWEHDHPEYEKTGIRYYGLYHPCRLVCKPPLGPQLDIASGKTWQSFRVFELLHDSTDFERRGLQRRKMWRTIAPWSQENPIFMHVRSAKPNAVKLAIDQCAEVGFEMVIMTFWSGFQAENGSPEYLKQMKELADYAKSKGIALGGYSLLASRGGNPKHLVIDPKTGQPGGAKFGPSPCLCSEWGLNYFDTLRNLFATTGLNVFEHDGSYPGDKCASAKHPGHRGYEDSQWCQWEQIRDYYRWCRANGIYLNVPDWHFLNGSSKTAMGYVETNWSLPRAHQEIIERQNIFDGTFEKTPSMGWMFVPLTQYHGGGAAATIEPLKDHLQHYETRLTTLFTSGVQAIYRGPRLYDAPQTKAVVKKWVDFYKQHRAILDSDIIHLRRADGRDIDYMLHVNPSIEEKGLLTVFNPLPRPVTKTIKVPLYYTGLKDSVSVKSEDDSLRKMNLSRDYSVELDVVVPAKTARWYIFR